MSFLISTLCFLFVCLIGVWGGVMLHSHYEKSKFKTSGKLIIVRDETDGKTYTALAMDPLVMSALEDGDHVELAVEVRQQNSFYNG